MADMNFDTLPAPHMRRAVEDYIFRGAPPGSFLTAFLCNDLRWACAEADHINQRLIWEWCHWFWNNAPQGCWGSRESFSAWTAVGGLTGKDPQDD